MDPKTDIMAPGPSWSHTQNHGSVSKISSKILFFFFTNKFLKKKKKTKNVASGENRQKARFNVIDTLSYN